MVGWRNTRLLGPEPVPCWGPLKETCGQGDGGAQAAKAGLSSLCQCPEPPRDASGETRVNQRQGNGPRHLPHRTTRPLTNPRGVQGLEFGKLGCDL